MYNQDCRRCSTSNKIRKRKKKEILEGYENYRNN